MALQKLMEKGKVSLSLGVTMEMEAYFATDFNANIIASHLLPEFVEILLTYSYHNRKSCVFLKKGSLDLNEILWKTDCGNSFYLIKSSREWFLVSNTPTLKGTEKYRNWHEVVGKISPERYQILSNLAKDVPIFPKSVTSKLHRVPCVTAKMQKSTVSKLKKSFRRYTDIHFDVFGTFKESFSRKTFVLQF